MSKNGKPKKEKQATHDGLKAKPESLDVHGELFRAMFRDGRLLVTKDGSRALRIDLAVDLTNSNSNLVPKEIREEYAALRGTAALDESKMNGAEMPVYIVELRMTPERKAGGLEVVSRLDRVLLRKIKAKDKPTTFELRFSATTMIGDDVWAWLRHSFGTPQWVSLEEAQGDMLDAFLDAEEEAKEAEEEAQEAEKETVN